MGPDIVFLIPITAIVLGAGGGIIKTILSSQERRLELRLQAQQGQEVALLQQVAALRAEVSALRNTSAEFDLSLDAAVQQLDHRVSSLETKKTEAAYTTKTDFPQILRPGSGT